MICLNLRIFGLSRKYTLCKFRTTNHKLPIETGRWNNIDRVNRICTKCNNITIGDEYHYIIECEHFSNFRNNSLYLTDAY
jgi:hypothetical protein